MPVPGAGELMDALVLRCLLVQLELDVFGMLQQLELELLDPPV